jgi:hypothetical protein
VNERVTLKGQVIAEIVAGNPKGRLKAVEYGQHGDIRRVEWFDDVKLEKAPEDATPFQQPRMQQVGKVSNQESKP